MDSRSVYTSEGNLMPYDEILSAINDFYLTTNGECEFCGSTEGFNITNITINDKVPPKNINRSMEEILSSGDILTIGYEKLIFCSFKVKRSLFGNEKLESTHQPIEKNVGGVLMIQDAIAMVLAHDPSKSKQEGYNEVFKSAIDNITVSQTGNLIKMTGYTETYSEGDINRVEFCFGESSKANRQFGFDFKKSIIVRVFDQKNESEVEIILINAAVNYELT
jgi:hypothetical protein